MSGPTPKPPSDADNLEESRRFIETAREIEAEETPEAMERAFKSVAHPKVRPEGAPSAHRSRPSEKKAFS